jgi:hypothetical protein
MKMKTILAVAWALSVCCAATAQVSYTIAESGAPGCAASAINDSAAIAGQCNGIAATWVNGTSASLGKLAGGSYSVAQWINSQAVAVRQ